MELKLAGRVVSGRGEGKKYLQLAWVQRQIGAKLGFKPYVGTLNLFLDEESTKKRSLLGKDSASDVCTAEGFCVGFLFKASISDLSCGVVTPQVDGYPSDLLEIIASVKLRQKLGLHDGDRVEVTVFL
jgi:riboflavin kinase